MQYGAEETHAPTVIHELLPERPSRNRIDQAVTLAQAVGRISPERDHTRLLAGAEYARADHPCYVFFVSPHAVVPVPVAVAVDMVKVPQLSVYAGRHQDQAAVESMAGHGYGRVRRYDPVVTRPAPVGQIPVPVGCSPCHYRLVPEERRILQQGCESPLAELCPALNPEVEVIIVLP